MDTLSKAGKPLKEARILILGAAYKKDVDDLRESPTLKLIELFQDQGAVVDYNDPHIPVMPKVRRYDYDMKSVDLTEKTLSSYDLVFISTAHSAYDYDFIVKHSRLVVDTRNATVDVKEGREKIIKA